MTHAPAPAISPCDAVLSYAVSMAAASSSKSAKSKQSPYIKHPIEIASAKEFNEEAKKWFRRAYDMDAR